MYGVLDSTAPGIDADANAALIAAAPDLAEALREIAYVTDAHEAREIATAALEKAGL
jgi:hypothetical protein